MCFPPPVPSGDSIEKRVSRRTTPAVAAAVREVVNFFLKLAKLVRLYLTLVRRSSAGGCELEYRALSAYDDNDNDNDNNDDDVNNDDDDDDDDGDVVDDNDDTTTTIQEALRFVVSSCTEEVHVSRRREGWGGERKENNANGIVVVVKESPRATGPYFSMGPVGAPISGGSGGEGRNGRGCCGWSGGNRHTDTTTSLRLVSPLLSSPHVASPRLASPHVASPRLASPRFASRRVESRHSKRSGHGSEETGEEAPVSSQLPFYAATVASAA
uniref:Uncharacterized protein n=1 Tax=Vespula pensylvanica TaxID=30213 RepID=A0A834PAP7_VESPE|nr:hypothetical protein H0235_002802 [Vespula pensylvanica]